MYLARICVCVCVCVCVCRACMHVCAVFYRCIYAIRGETQTHAHMHARTHIQNIHSPSSGGCAQRSRPHFGTHIHINTHTKRTFQQVVVAVLRPEAAPSDLDLNLESFQWWRPVILIRRNPRQSDAFASPSMTPTQSEQILCLDC
jgi:hypothetical protein